jgi:hypothetical protein
MPAIGRLSLGQCLAGGLLIPVVMLGVAFSGAVHRWLDPRLMRRPVLGFAMLSGLACLLPV